jgi:hypothetical protein
MIASKHITLKRIKKKKGKKKEKQGKKGAEKKKYFFKSDVTPKFGTK